jgi:glycosyltransferase involved in cell wall biosynthesis
MSLTVYLPVHNEEKHLDECLRLLSFADEILVQLDKCTDRSKEIALANNAKIIEGRWDTEGDRRNAGIEACSGDWILEIDADERVTPELAKEILETIKTSTADLHCIPMDNYIGDRLVRYGWGAYIGVSQKVLLFRKWAKTYIPETRVTHAEVKFNGNFGPVLKHHLVHYMDKNLSDTIRRFDSYTTARAKDLLNSGNMESFGRNVPRLFSRFYKAYIRRKGYKEGSLGFFIGVLAGLYPMVSYIKAKYKLL